MCYNWQEDIDALAKTFPFHLAAKNKVKKLALRDNVSNQWCNLKITRRAHIQLTFNNELYVKTWCTTIESWSCRNSHSISFCHNSSKHPLEWLYYNITASILILNCTAHQSCVYVHTCAYVLKKCYFWNTSDCIFFYCQKFCQNKSKFMTSKKWENKLCISLTQFKYTFFHALYGLNRIHWHKFPMTVCPSVANNYLLKHTHTHIER